jgi:hypothetical protein
MRRVSLLRLAKGLPPLSLRMQSRMLLHVHPSEAGDTWLSPHD